MFKGNNLDDPKNLWCKMMEYLKGATKSMSKLKSDKSKYIETLLSQSTLIYWCFNCKLYFSM